MRLTFCVSFLGPTHPMVRENFMVTIIDDEIYACVRIFPSLSILEIDKPIVTEEFALG